MRFEDQYGKRHENVLSLPADKNLDEQDALWTGRSSELPTR
jgi:hypothetical protein